MMKELKKELKRIYAGYTQEEIEEAHKAALKEIFLEEYFSLKFEEQIKKLFEKKCPLNIITKVRAMKNDIIKNAIAKGISRDQEVPFIPVIGNWLSLKSLSEVTGIFMPITADQVVDKYDLKEEIYFIYNPEIKKKSFLKNKTNCTLKELIFYMFFTQKKIGQDEIIFAKGSQISEERCPIITNNADSSLIVFWQFLRNAGKANSLIACCDR